MSTNSQTSVAQLLGLLFRAHPWHGIPTGEDAPSIVTSYIEIVPTDTVKYEIDKESGLLKIDRPQRYSNICPTLYGFIPRTLCAKHVGTYCSERIGRSGIIGDGDPLDICILSEKTIPRGDILLQAIPIGGLRMIDGNQADDKIIAVLRDDAVYGNWRKISDCPSTLVERLRHYFLTYKDAPDATERRCEIPHVYDQHEAHEVIRRSQKDYREDFGDPEALLVTALQRG
ncbi:MAG: inorganic pyrophosphatase [Candidatus Binatia bacterium]